MQPISQPADKTGVAPLDVDDRDDVRAVAEMHASNFPETTEARCGLNFMTRFYYPELIRAGLLGCVVAHRDGRVVGYITYTRFAMRVLKVGARRMPLRFGLSLGLAALSSVDACKAIANHIRGALTPYASTGAPALPPGCGQVLLLATAPEHQTWIPPGGSSRITVRLFEAMEEYFRGQGVTEILLRVWKTNSASNLFLHSMGCRLDPSANHPRNNYYWYTPRAGGEDG